MQRVPDCGPVLRPMAHEPQTLNRKREAFERKVSL